jgi:hypothetical protein
MRGWSAFSARRMVNDYVEQIYRPLAHRRAVPLALVEEPDRDALAA